MTRTPKVVLALVALVALLALPSMDVGAARPAQAPAADRDVVSLGGSDAHGYTVPPSMELARSFDLPTYGLTYERYQQMHEGAEVLGGQITVYRDDAGESQLVIGARYEGIAPTNDVRITGDEAEQRAARDVGEALERTVTLRLDPVGQRFVYEVDSIQPAGRWRHLIDAGSGGIADRLNTLTTDCTTAPCGHGVAYDDGDTRASTNLSGLTTLSGSQYLLRSADGRQETHDQGSTKRPFLGPIATDGDNLWTTPGDASPAQGALVDAQYYANVSDDYLTGEHTFNWVSALGLPTMEMQAHYSKAYNNAFWNGRYVALGDGDQITFRELTSLDVVAHELAHGVTDATSNLVYENESGALNESFSDVIAASTEIWAEAANLELEGLDGGAWEMGDEFDLRTDVVSGFRNMADPEEDGHPDHYSELYTGTSDNGGVHSNSGIPNHAFYLLAIGGQNASCASPTDHKAAHCTDTNDEQDNNVTVTGVTVPVAADIFFLGFGALAENATMCEARAATEAGAGTHALAVTAAWLAVGVTDLACGTTVDGNNAPNASFTYSCTNLACDFNGTGSSDSDGSISSYVWTFGDGSDASGSTASHTYAAAGTYTVSLTVTDNEGATDTDAQSVSVSEAGDYSLTATGYKVKGQHHADLTWSGAASANVDVYHESAVIATTANDGAYTHSTTNKGKGSYTYKVCDTGTATCSNEAVVVFG